MSIDRLRNLSAISVLVVTGLFGSSCATVPPEEDPVVIKLNEMDQRLVRLERVLNNESLVEMLAESQAMQEEIRQLRGQIETLEYELEGAATRQRNLYVDLDQRLQEIETGGSSGVGLTGAPAIPSVAVDPTATGTTGGPAAGLLPVPTGSDRDNYDAAFNMLKEGRYEEAASGFRQFLQAFPDSTYADNAQYWLAESHYVTRAFGEALGAFNIVVDEYPDSRKIPDALLKIGYCHYELRNWGNARTALQRVLDTYPDTTAAKLASDRLRRMGKEER